jgi:hypothetical protein
MSSVIDADGEAKQAIGHAKGTIPAEMMIARVATH